LLFGVALASAHASAPGRNRHFAEALCLSTISKSRSQSWGYKLRQAWSTQILRGVLKTQRRFTAAPRPCSKKTPGVTNHAPPRALAHATKMSVTDQGFVTTKIFAT
jgi:hypothetical protein